MSEAYQDYNPVVAVVGSGAVGSYYGARLAQHGTAVHFLMRSDYQAVRQHGLTVRSCAGDFSLAPRQVNVYNDPKRMPPADLVIVTLKTTANDQYQPLIAPLLKADTAILTLQNGLGNEERLAELFGERRVLGGMAFTCINRLGPGVVDHSAHGYIRLGEMTGGPSARAGAIAAMFKRSNVPCEVLQDLRYGRWEKLVWNVPFNSLSAVLDQTTDLILSTPTGIRFVRAVMAEVIAAAAGCGVRLPESLIDLNINRTLEMDAYRTSMHIDRQTGRAMEVEAIVGQPMRSAERHGVPTPCIRSLYALLTMVAARTVA